MLPSTRDLCSGCALPARRALPFLWLQSRIKSINPDGARFRAPSASRLRLHDPSSLDCLRRTLRLQCGACGPPHARVGRRPMSAQRQRGGRTSRAPVRIEMTRVSHGLRAVCQECICACKAELVACLRSTTRTRVRVCLRGLEDEDYVRDIFGDLLAILKSGEEGTWCYHEGAFVDVSIVPKTPSPPCAQQLSAGSTVYTEQDDGVGSPQGEWERGGLLRRVDDD